MQTVKSLSEQIFRNQLIADNLRDLEDSDHKAFVAELDSERTNLENQLHDVKVHIAATEELKLFAEEFEDEENKALVKTLTARIEEMQG